MLDYLPVHTPKAVRNCRLFGRHFLIAYLNSWTAYIPFHTICDALELDNQTAVDRYTQAPYLALAWSNILLPDGDGQPRETLCFKLNMLPILLIGISLDPSQSTQPNGLLTAFCHEASALLAGHFHLGDEAKIQECRRSLAMDVADTMRLDTEYPDPF